MHIFIYSWMMTQMCYIILEYLLVLTVDVWTTIFLTWSFFLFEAMNGLMITIVDNINIHYHIISLVILNINCLRLKLYEVDKLTYFLLSIWIVLFVIFLVTDWTVHAILKCYARRCFSQLILLFFILNMLLA
jgi:hypothetical protein